MEQTNLRSKRLKGLSRGRVKTIGILEGLRLRIAGWIDGARCLPRQTEAGDWQSAFMNREINGFEEFASSMWSMLQLEKEGSFARLNVLTAAIPLNRIRIVEMKAILLDAEQEETFACRKNGEENLTDDQVRSRRAREREKQLAPLREKLRRMEEQLVADIAEFTALRSALEEDANTIRMAIHRVQDHMLQRLDLYWSAVLRTHPDSDLLPAAPGNLRCLRAEQAYTELHRALMEKTDALQLQRPGEEAA